MCQWLLNKDVFTKSHRLHSDGEVRVVRGGDQHSVDLVSHLIEHHAKIGELLGLGMRLDASLGMPTPEIDITEGHYIAVTGLDHVLEVSPALIADTHNRQTHFLIGRDDLRATAGTHHQRSRKNRNCTRCGRALEEITTGGLGAHTHD